MGAFIQENLKNIHVIISLIILLLLVYIIELLEEKMILYHLIMDIYVQM